MLIQVGIVSTSPDVVYPDAGFRNILSGKEKIFQPLPWRITMKRLSIIAFVSALMMTSVGPATAHQNNGVEGLLLGGAGGAILGQAIARNPEGVIVGSLIGGTLGMLVDIGSVRDRVVVIDRPHYPPRVGYVSGNHRDYRQDKWAHRRFEQRRRSGRWERGR
jgi:hypothetical protein